MDCDVLDHIAQINAPTYLPTNDVQIPTGTFSHLSIYFFLILVRAAQNNRAVTRSFCICDTQKMEREQKRSKEGGGGGERSTQVELSSSFLMILPN